MNKMEKIGVALAMSLGIMAGITAVLKTAYLPGMGHWQDFTCKLKIMSRHVRS